MAGYDDFSSPVAQAPSGLASPYDAFSSPTGAAHESSVVKELATQPVYGFNEGFDALYNLPNAAVNVGAHVGNLAANAVRRKLGHPEQEYAAPLGYARIASRFNEPDPWQNIANDAAETFGAKKPFPDAAPQNGGDQPTTTAGRYGRSIGQQAGASVLPMAGMVRAGVIPATNAALAQNAASLAGAGVTTEAAKEAGFGPIGQTIAGVAGGFAAPAVYNIGARAGGIGKNAVAYGRQTVEEARNPQLAADRDVSEAIRKAGTTPEELREAVLPPYPRGSDLPSRGFTREHLADIVGRGLDKEEASTIAADYAHLRNAQGQAISPDTVNNYIRRYGEANPTPMNLMDLTEEASGVGGALPVTRLARSNQIVSRDAIPAQRLYERQAQQQARATGIVDRALPNPSTAEETNAAARAAQQRAVDLIDREYPAQNYEQGKTALQEAHAKEANKAYAAFYDREPLLHNNLDDLLEDTLFQKAVSQGRAQSRASAINANQKAERAGKPDRVTVPSLENDPLYTPELLDKIQRQLRITGESYTNPNDAAHARDLRQIFLDRIEGHYPEFRGIRQNYASGMGDQEALAAGATLEPVLNEKTYGTLADFEAMTPVQKELFRVRFARKIQDAVQNHGYGSEPLAQFDSPAATAVIRRVFPRDVADRIITGLEREQVTANAMSMGEDIAAKAGSANTRDALRTFRAMDPAQKELFRRGFSTKLRSMINAKNDGQDVASQFNNENTRNFIRAVVPDQADALIRNLAREAITTRTKNAIYGNSTTAQQTYDVNQALEAARTAGHVGRGAVSKVLDDWGTWLARKIGEDRATHVVRQLTATDPADMLRTLDRLISTAPTPVERNALAIFRGQPREYGPGRAWMAGEAAQSVNRAGEPSKRLPTGNTIRAVLAEAREKLARNPGSERVKDAVTKRLMEHGLTLDHDPGDLLASPWGD
jgi:hypothetical protein